VIPILLKDGGSIQEEPHFSAGFIKTEARL
jgi:hypothetical protein